MFKHNSKLFKRTFAFAVAACALPIFAQDTNKPDVLKLKGHGTWEILSQFKDYEKPFWTEEVPKLTEGRVQVDYTAFNTAGLKGPEIVRLVKLGALDLGTTVLSYVSAEDPIAEGVDLAGAMLDSASARKVTEAYMPTLSEHLGKKYDMRVLGLWPYPAQMLLCKGAITNLDSLKGKRVRVSLRTTSDLIEAYGAITVSIPFDEVYKKLKDGSVDCLVTGTLPANAAKFYEVATHLYVLPLGWSMMMAGVSNSSWDKIQPNDQTALLAGIQKLSNNLWAASESQTEQGIVCNAGKDSCKLGTKGKMTIVQATEADRAKLRGIVSRVVVKRWAERCGKDCESTWFSKVGKIVGVQPKG